MIEQDSADEMFEFLACHKFLSEGLGTREQGQGQHLTAHLFAKAFSGQIIFLPGQKTTSARLLKVIKGLSRLLKVIKGMQFEVAGFCHLNNTAPNLEYHSG